MKKITSFITSVMILTAAVSCSGKPKESTNAPIAEPKLTADGKPVITVGTIGYVDPLFNDYLNNPTDVEIETINYYAGLEADVSPQANKDESINRIIDLEIISGNAPDILCLPPEFMTHFIRSGTMTDLYELMDEYDGFKREDFTDCALEGLTIDGKLPAIIERYNIETAAAKTEFVGSEYTNWTAAQAMEIYNRLPEFDKNMQFCEFEEKLSLADFMLKNEGISCIDMKTNKCDFSGSFTELLDFCKQHPIHITTDLDFSKMSDYEWSSYMDERELRGINNEQLVVPISIDGFSSTLSVATYSFFGGKDVTFVGYPSENGQGAFTTATFYPMLGICEQSCNKELAWDIINRMINHRKTYYTDGYEFGIPTLKKQLKEQYDSPKDSTNSINSEIYMPLCDEPQFLPQEYKDMLYEYIQSVPVDLYTPRSLRYIIEEEYEPVILDSRTAEDAADILQNRIETYLSE